MSTGRETWGEARDAVAAALAKLREAESVRYAATATRKGLEVELAGAFEDERSASEELDGATADYYYALQQAARELEPTREVQA